MSIETYLDLSFERVGIRDSEKRLKGAIIEAAVEPLRAFRLELEGDFDTLEEIVRKRVAGVIAHWAQHKHNPLRPSIDDLMSDITEIETARDDMVLGDFYAEQVKDGLYALAADFNVDVPIAYLADVDELEFALLLLEERMAEAGALVEPEPEPVMAAATASAPPRSEERTTQRPWSAMRERRGSNGASPRNQQTQEATQVTDEAEKSETHIVLTEQANIETAPPKEINVDTLSITADDAWQMVYGLMGFQSEYIQQKMLPRWKQQPDTFDQDRRFLYNVFIQAIRNASGVTYAGGNHIFTGGSTSIDQLWNHYFRDLSQNVGPMLSAARLEIEADAPWYRRAWIWVRKRSKNLSIMWLLALVIALVFDGLTTYVSLDQTPMDGPMVLVFTVLITALFQIADILVIDYRKREFESDALIAKYKAKMEQIEKSLASLDPSSDSFVNLSMQRSQANADWKAAEDNRRMARRGRYWSARIADINVVVTAYGFAYLFLNAEEPMFALYQQIDYIFVQQMWDNVNLWVFLMIGLAITVSFVINTAQRTEILGWSMRRLKNEA